MKLYQNFTIPLPISGMVYQNFTVSLPESGKPIRPTKKTGLSLMRKLEQKQNICRTENGGIMSLTTHILLEVC